MNIYKTDTNGSLAVSAPLFASVWLALYYVLRNNFNERRRLAAAAYTKSAQVIEKK